MDYDRVEDVQEDLTEFISENWGIEVEPELIHTLAKHIVDLIDNDLDVSDSDTEEEIDDNYFV